MARATIKHKITIDVKASNEILDGKNALPVKVFNQVDINSPFPVVNKAIVEIQHQHLGDVLEVSQYHGVKANFQDNQLVLEGKAPSHVYETILETISFKAQPGSSNTAREVVIRLEGSESKPVGIEVFKDGRVKGYEGKSREDKRDDEQAKQADERETHEDNKVQETPYSEDNKINLSKISQRVNELENEAELKAAVEKVENLESQFNSSKSESSEAKQALISAFEAKLELLNKMGIEVQSPTDYFGVKVTQAAADNSLSYAGGKFSVEMIQAYQEKIVKAVEQALTKAEKSFNIEQLQANVDKAQNAMLEADEPAGQLAKDHPDVVELSQLQAKLALADITQTEKNNLLSQIKAATEKLNKPDDVLNSEKVLSEAQAELSAAQAKQAELQSKMAEYQAILESTYEETMGAELYQSQTKVTNLENARTAAEENLSTLEASLSSFSATLANRTDISPADTTKQVTLEKQLADAKVALEVFARTQPDHGKVVADAKTAFDALMAESDTLQAELSSVKSKLGQLEGLEMVGAEFENKLALEKQIFVLEFSRGSGDFDPVEHAATKQALQQKIDHANVNIEVLIDMHNLGLDPSDPALLSKIPTETESIKTSIYDKIETSPGLQNILPGQAATSEQNVFTLNNWLFQAQNKLDANQANGFDASEVLVEHIMQGYGYNEPKKTVADANAKMPEYTSKYNDLFQTLLTKQNELALENQKIDAQNALVAQNTSELQTAAFKALGVDGVDALLATLGGDQTGYLDANGKLTPKALNAVQAKLEADKSTALTDFKTAADAQKAGVAELAALEHEAAKLEGEKGSLSNAKADVLAKMTELKSQLEKSAALVAEKTLNISSPELTAHQKAINAHEAKIANLNIQLDGLKASLATAEGKLNASEIQTLQAKISTLESSIETQNSKLSNEQAKATVESDNLTLDYENAQAALQTQYDQLLAQQTLLRDLLSDADFANFQTLLDDIKAKQDVLKATAKDLKGAINDAKDITPETKVAGFHSNAKLIDDHFSGLTEKNAEGYYVFAGDNVIPGLDMLGDLADGLVEDKTGSDRTPLVYDPKTEMLLLQDPDTKAYKPVMSIADLKIVSSPEYFVDSSSGQIYYFDGVNNEYVPSSQIMAKLLEGVLKGAYGSNAGSNHEAGLSISKDMAIKSMPDDEGPGQAEVLFSDPTLMKLLPIIMGRMNLVEVSGYNPSQYISDAEINSPGMQAAMSLFSVDTSGSSTAPAQLALLVKQIFPPSAIEYLGSMSKSDNVTAVYDPATQTFKLVDATTGASHTLLDFNTLLQGGTIPADHVNLTKGSYFKELYKGLDGDLYDSLSGLLAEIDLEEAYGDYLPKNAADKALYKVTYDIKLDYETATPEEIESALKDTLTKMGQAVDEIPADLMAKMADALANNDGDLALFYNPATKTFFFYDAAAGEYVSLSGEPPMQVGDALVSKEVFSAESISELESVLKDITSDHDAMFGQDFFEARGLTIQSIKEVTSGITEYLVTDAEGNETTYIQDDRQNEASLLAGLNSIAESGYSKVEIGTIAVANQISIGAATNYSVDTSNGFVAGETYSVTGNSSNNVFTISRDLLVENAGTHMLISGAAGSDVLAFSNYDNMVIKRHVLDDASIQVEVNNLTDGAIGNRVGIFDLDSVEYVRVSLGSSESDGISDMTGQSSALVNAVKNKYFMDVIGDSNDNTLNAASLETSGAYSVSLFGGAGDDTLIGGTSAGGTLSGGTGDDIITGGTNASADMILDGELGDDIITSGAGDDTMIGGGGSDTFIFDASTVFGDDVVYDIGSGASSLDPEFSKFSGASNTDFTATTDGDALILTHASKGSVTFADFFASNNNESVVFKFDTNNDGTYGGIGDSSDIDGANIDSNNPDALF